MSFHDFVRLQRVFATHPDYDAVAAIDSEVHLMNIVPSHSQFVEFSRHPDVMKFRTHLDRMMYDEKYFISVVPTIDEYYANSQYKEGEELYKGEDGSVVSICTGDGTCPRVMKKIKIRNSIFMEVFACLRAAQAKVGPEIYEVVICRQGGEFYTCITMERYERTTADMVLSDDDIDQIYELISKLHVVGVHHGDLYQKHVVTKSNGPRKFALIDYGSSWIYEPRMMDARLKAVDYVTFFNGVNIGGSWIRPTLISEERSDDARQDIAASFMGANRLYIDAWGIAIRWRLNMRGTSLDPYGGDGPVITKPLNYYVVIFNTVPLIVINLEGVNALLKRVKLLHTDTSPKRDVERCETKCRGVLEEHYNELLATDLG